MSYKVIKAPLIVDSDRDFLSAIGSDPLLNSECPLLAHDFDSAVEAMRSEGGFISALVISPSLGSDVVGKIIRHAYDTMFGVAIFFLCEPAKSKRDNEARAMATQQLLEKPLSYSQILDWVNDAAKKTKRPRGDKRRARPTGKDEDFVPLVASILMTDGTLTMDVYVRLRAGRYVRIVSAGEQLEQERLDRYINKGLKEFYLRKSEQDSYQKTCEHLTTMLAVITSRNNGEKTG